jgi:hypothetical protein
MEEKMLEQLGILLGTKIEVRDFVAFAALFVTVLTFVLKLTADTKIARYRETVAFIEKREAEMRKRWRDINLGNVTGGDLEEETRILIGQLELVSLLMRKNVFDSELVFNYWWRYFDEPLQKPQINSWIQLCREQDPSLFEHYLHRCKVWADRLDKELGRPRRTWWKRLLLA